MCTCLTVIMSPSLFYVTSKFTMTFSVGQRVTFHRFIAVYMYNPSVSPWGSTIHVQIQCDTQFIIVGVRQLWSSRPHHRTHTGWSVSVNTENSNVSLPNGEMIYTNIHVFVIMIIMHILHSMCWPKMYVITTRKWSGGKVMFYSCLSV